MIVEKSGQIIREIGKVLVGKNEVVEKVLMTIYAGGHILVEDVPLQYYAGHTSRVKIKAAGDLQSICPS